MRRANPEIDALLAELLDSGVSPKYVARLSAELEDHYADLEAEAKRLGVPDGDAASDARLRLGDCSVIAKEFERRPELKSWVYTSRWLECVLRLVGAAYLLVLAPARFAAAGQGAMLRYTAATAAGASVTFAILLLLTALMPSQTTWGVRLIENAGAALGAWELEPSGRRNRSAVGGSERALEAGLPTSVRFGALRGGQRREKPASRRSRPEIGSESAALLRRRPLFRPVEAHLRGEHYPLTRPSFERYKARVVLADLKPPLVLGIDDRDFKPVVEATPDYPVIAARRGLEGYVLVEYTVTRHGTVEDAVVVESSHPLFNRAALDATRDFKYEPRVIGGQAVGVSGVRVMIRFELEV